MSSRSDHEMEPYRPMNMPFGEATVLLGTAGETIYQAIAAVAGAIRRASEAMETRARERAMVEMLAGLDDSTLNDIGVPRGEIRTLARKFARCPVDDYRSLCR